MFAFGRRSPFFMVREQMRLLFALLFLLVSPGLMAGDAFFYVSPSGNDGLDGRARIAGKSGIGPFRTIVRAKQEVRAALMDPQVRRVVVFIEKGSYELDQPLFFRPEDAGREGVSVTYKGDAEGTVEVLGGVGVSGCKRHRDRIAVCDLKGVPHLNGSIESLYINGQRKYPAQTPNKGEYFFVKGTVKSDGQKGALYRKRRFLADLADLSKLRLENAVASTKPRVLLVHAWETSQHTVDQVDARTGEVVIHSPTYWGFNQFGPAQKYYFYNIASSLDSPGEWYFDARKSKLYYFLEEYESFDALKVVIPFLDRFVVVQGEPSRPVQNLTIENISFRFADNSFPENGYASPQAAVDVGAAIEVEYADRFSLNGAFVRSVGGYGVWLKKGVRDSFISDNEFSDLGAGGVKVGEVVEPSQQEDRVLRNVVSGNYIHSVGLVHPGAVGIWVGFGSDNWIEKNVVRDTSYSAISVGWSWGYGKVDSTGNVVRFNIIEDVGRGLLSDLGGIYFLGYALGSVVNNNYIRGVRSPNDYGSGAWGIYADEGTEGLVVSNNYVEGAQSGGFHLHYGRNLVVANNVFIGDGGTVWAKTRSESAPSIAFERNLVVLRGAKLFAGDMQSSGIKSDQNVYICDSGCKPEVVLGEVQGYRSHGQDSRSVIDRMHVGCSGSGLRLFQCASGYEVRGSSFSPIDISVVDSLSMKRMAGEAQK